MAFAVFGPARQAAAAAAAVAAAALVESLVNFDCELKKDFHFHIVYSGCVDHS